MTLFNPIHLNRKNRKVQKINWSDNEKRFLLKHSKEIPLSALAEKLGRPVKQVRNQCDRIGCGYFS